MALEIGSRLGHYDVTALIGEGDMGQVYEVIDTQAPSDFAEPSRQSRRPQSGTTI